MTRAPVTIGPDAPLAELDALLLRQRVGGVPVVERGRLVGIVTRSDVVRVLGTEDSIAGVQEDFLREFAPEPAASRKPAAEHVAERLAALRVRDAMTPDVVCVAADAPLREVAEKLVARRIHRVVVLDGDRVAGIVSTLDLAREIAAGRLAPV
jgi:CBS domain-containing protein